MSCKPFHLPSTAGDYKDLDILAGSCREFSKLHIRIPFLTMLENY
jgi:hypothetical protein